MAGVGLDCDQEEAEAVGGRRKEIGLRVLRGLHSIPGQGRLCLAPGDTLGSCTPRGCCTPGSRRSEACR